MVAILGTFSSGKSTFINTYVGTTVQRTGTQAVDDKFTVLCYSSSGETQTLPGVALDADPRFPFYQVSRSIEEISAAGNQRIDAYLQLKACHSEALRGKIMIDSPGFDADSQRAATLRLTDHIIGLADLVLVFFDARHPEPGVMKDTLDHLVSRTIERPDSNKFLYILNQMDVTAKEDNPEEVVAAWQRALAGAGLTAGRFYRIYNKKAAVPIDDQKVKERMEAKCDADMKEIETRMQQVETERAYRIIGSLEQTAKDIEHKLIPQLSGLIQSWRAKVMAFDVLIAFIALLVLGASISATGMWDNVIGLVSNPLLLGISVGLIAVVSLYIHFMMRDKAKHSVLRKLQTDVSDEYTREQLSRAFIRNTRWWRSVLMSVPAGWNANSRREISEILGDANKYVQDLNSHFADPSGKKNV